jgi:hypothetical protein
MAKAAPIFATGAWGTPDPRVESAYPPVAPPGQWAWELLRRRNDYRNRWLELIGRFLDDPDSTWLENEMGIALGRLEREFRIMFTTRPGSNTALDPRIGTPPIFQGLVPVIIEAMSPTLLSVEEYRAPRKIAFEIDETLPTGPQITAVVRYLEQRAKHFSAEHAQPRPPFRNFSRLLRLLDFDSKRASDKEIGAHLLPGAEGKSLHNWIDDNLKAARRWQNDYLLVALHPSAFS